MSWHRATEKDGGRSVFSALQRQRKRVRLRGGERKQDKDIYPL